jgi:D-arabinose 1-dehydrogenase-like Zn-dependent alcohol dehydrogenase
MSDKLTAYRRVEAPLPERYRLWPLYGAGFENLGRNGKWIEVPMPTPGPQELLVRHDAVGICFSDIKVIRAGENHPRIYRNMRQNPVVLGHEVSLTVVQAGEDLRDTYHVGDRFIVQADIYIGGVSYAYGYEIQGGFSQYNIIDHRVLNSDGGNYLIPVQPSTGYAEAALNEPWACVEASYTVKYRTQWREGGVLWLTGSGEGVGLGRATGWRPGRIVLDVTDKAFAVQIRAWARAVGAEIIQDDPEISFDDIVILDNDPELIERGFDRLAKGGAFNVVTPKTIPRPVQLDVGRLHYDHLSVFGANTPDLSAAYGPIRAQLKPGGAAWILGAAGPMGHMHLQRALEIPERPRLIVASNIHNSRMQAAQEKFAPLARQQNVELICRSLEAFADEAELLADLQALSDGQGFDDIVVLAPNVRVIESAMALLADQGVMNIFAGLPRGTRCGIDLNAVVQRGIRFVGTSGSSIEDLRHMLDLTESHTLSTNSVVAAVAGLEGVPDGLRAVAEGRFPGKVVIYPNLGSSLPLTPLPDLKDRFPSVYAKLKDGQIWTNAAEEELLRLLL